MSVIATPAVSIQATPAAPSPASSQVVCSDQNLKIAPVTNYFGTPVLSKLRAVQINAGQHTRLRWTFIDANGFPINLTECGFPGAGSSSSSSSFSSSSGDEVGFRTRIRENLSIGVEPLPAQTEYPVTLIDSEAGVVVVELTKDSTNVPGVYFVEIAAFDRFDTDDEQMLFSNIFYLIINRGQFGSTRHNQTGPPSIMEVRLHLRDSGAAENLLLDNLKFDDAEIALAISRPLDYWNEIPPPLGQRMTTQNFPFRYHWLEAIAANLFWIAAENFRANNLTYSAAGIQVNDQNKEPGYEQAASRRDAEWKNFVRRKKSELNLASGFGGIGSGYGYGYYYGGRYY